MNDGSVSPEAKLFSTELLGGKRFQVHVHQPSEIYSLITDKASGENMIIRTISSDVFEDGFLRNEMTEIGRHNDRFSMETKLWLSDIRTSKEDGGFLDGDTISRIQKQLEIDGLEVIPHTSQIESGNSTSKNIFVLEKDEVQIEVDLGHNSRQSAENEKWGEVCRLIRAGEDGYTRQYLIPDITKGLTNNLITFRLVNPIVTRDGREVGYSNILPTPNETEFGHTIDIYANIYEQLINALYTQQEENPPLKTVTLEPDVKVDPERGVQGLLNTLLDVVLKRWEKSDEMVKFAPSDSQIKRVIAQAVKNGIAAGEIVVELSDDLKGFNPEVDLVELNQNNQRESLSNGYVVRLRFPSNFFDRSTLTEEILAVESSLKKAYGYDKEVSNKNLPRGKANSPEIGFVQTVILSGVI